LSKLSTIALQKEPYAYPFNKQDSISQQLDPLGERDVFYERDQSIEINRRILTDAKDITTATMDSKPSGMPITDLVQAYLDHEPAYIPQVARTVNYYIPDFSRLDVQGNAVYNALQTSSYAMNELKTYYNEKCEILYHFILSKYLILKQQAKYGLVNNDQRDFVDAFSNTFSPDMLPISGTYRPFYIGLNSATPADKRFSDVIPYLPAVSDMQMTAENNQLAPMPLFSLVPNFAALIRILHQQGGQHPAPPAQYQVSTYDNDNRLNEDNLFWNYPNPNMNDVWNDNRMLRWRRWTPGTLNRAARVRSMQDIGQYPYSPFFPTPSYRTIAQAINNEFQEMGFEHNFNWFENLITQQNRICRYFPGSTTLDKLVAPSTGYGLYVNHLSTGFTAEDFHAYDDTHQAANVQNDLAALNAQLTNFRALQIPAPAQGAQPNAVRQAYNALIDPIQVRHDALEAQAALPDADPEEAVFDLVNPIRLQDPNVPPLLRTEMYQSSNELEVNAELQKSSQITNWHTNNYITNACQIRGVNVQGAHLYHGRYWNAYHVHIILIHAWT